MSKVFNINSHEFSQDAEKFLATLPEEGDIEAFDTTMSRAEADG
jgi:hypothetical protein